MCFKSFFASILPRISVCCQVPSHVCLMFHMSMHLDHAFMQVEKEPLKGKRKQYVRHCFISKMGSQWWTLILQLLLSIFQIDSQFPTVPHSNKINDGNDMYAKRQAKCIWTCFIRWSAHLASVKGLFKANFFHLNNKSMYCVVLTEFTFDPFIMQATEVNEWIHFTGNGSEIRILKNCWLMSTFGCNLFPRESIFLPFSFEPNGS